MDCICYTILRCGAIRDNHKCRLIMLHAIALFYSFTTIHGKCTQWRMANTSSPQLFSNLLQRKDSIAYSTEFTTYSPYSKYLECLQGSGVVLFSIDVMQLGIFVRFKGSKFQTYCYSFFQDFQNNKRHNSAEEEWFRRFSTHNSII